MVRAMIRMSIFALGATFLLPALGLAQTPVEVEAPERSEQDEARRLRTYARVGDVVIRVGDLEDRIAAQSAFVREELRDRARLAEFAEGIVRSELLAREAARREYDQLAVVRQAYRESLVQNLLRKEIDESITRESISAQDVEAHFQRHQEEFARPAMRRAAHLVVATLAEANELLAEARETDVRGFRDLVRRHSTDTETKYRGGDLRYFRRDGRSPAAPTARREDGPGGREPDPPVDAAIVAAAFALETVGDLSEPIAIGENFSIVKLTGAREEESPALADVQDGIRLQLWRQRRQSAIDAMVMRLREAAGVEVHSERLRAIRLDPVEPAEAFDDGHGHDRHPVIGEEGASAMSAAGAASTAPTKMAPSTME